MSEQQDAELAVLREDAAELWQTLATLARQVRHYDPDAAVAAEEVLNARCYGNQPTTFTVTVTRSLSVDVEVEAESAEEAVGYVNRHDFRLPPRDEWEGLKDWSYAVYRGSDLIYEEQR